MMKRTINSKKAPQAIGPYSQAVQTGQLLYVSGQLPVDAATGQLVQSNIEAETKQVLENIKAIIEEAGAKMADIVKTTIFIKDMNDFQRVNEAYQDYFQTEPPARVCIEVSKLPKDANIEIDAIAYIG
ncbi:MAG: RidA family protein [Dehalobacterium sp.]